MDPPGPSPPIACDCLHFWLEPGNFCVMGHGLAHGSHRWAPTHHSHQPLGSPRASQPPLSPQWLSSKGLRSEGKGLEFDCFIFLPPSTTASLSSLACSPLCLPSLPLASSYAYDISTCTHRTTLRSFSSIPDLLSLHQTRHFKVNLIRISCNCFVPAITSYSLVSPPVTK
jgi:hypothetical protein